MKMNSKISLFLMLMMVAGASHAELKIGFVNIAKVLEKAPQAAKAKSRLESEFSAREKSLLAQQKELKTMDERLTKDGSVMGEAERHKLERDLMDKSRDFQRAQQEFSEDINVRRNEELGNLQKRIAEVVRQLAKEDGYDLLLSEVLFANEAIDVTARVQQKLESAGQ
jgi:outer membrane protein